jgi:serine/threonine protein kinase/Tol biopolymer transport system component
MIGFSISRYVVESKLGEGGMGVVYKAHDPQLARAVAIKVLPPEMIADPERKRRFVQEARAASALNHPNIVTVHDIGADGDRDYIVMEYLAGSTLDRRIPATGLPAREALRYAVAIADALAAAHQAGIVHRDLKPSNVLITDDGRVKVLDFGLAKLLESHESSESAATVANTDRGIVVGTTNYMSPEQADGRALDGRSDIFSFGSVMYEMVTGRVAFDADSRLAALGKIVNEDPPPPRVVNGSVPAEVERIVLRCLRKDPARRFQTMADLKVALEDLVIESGSAAAAGPSPPSVWHRWRWAAAALLPIAIGAVYFATRSAPQRTGDAPRAVPLISLSGVVRHPALSPDGNHVAFSWNGAGQDNPDIYVQQVGAGSPLRLTTDPGNDHSPAWSPDGRAIAFLRRKSDAPAHELRLVPPLGGPERKIADLRPFAALYRPITLTWCPDASCIVVTDGQGEGKPDALFAFPLEGGERRQLTFPPQNAVLDTDPAIAFDGSAIVFRRDLTPFTGEMYRIGLGSAFAAAGTPVRLTDVTVSGARPVWMPDNRRIVFAARGALWTLDAFSGGPPARLPFVGQEGSMPALARAASGSARLVYVRSSVDTNIWRIDTTAAGVPPAGPPRTAISSTRTDHLAMLSPDGKRLAFFSSRSGEFELWVADIDGANATQLTSLKSLPGFPRWSPDGESITFHSDPEGHPDVLTIRAAGGRFRIVTQGPLAGGYPSFSRDGRWIYYAGPNADGQIRIWKIPPAGGTPIQVTETLGAVTLESYDGRDLYYLEAGERPSAIFRMPTGGNTAPVKVADGVVNANIDLAERGLYYIDRAATAAAFVNDRPAGEARLRYYDFATGQITTVVPDLGRITTGLTVSRDGRTIFFSRIDSAADEVMVIDDFR